MRASVFYACAMQLQVAGPYASRLSDVDIQQIKHVISNRPEINPRLTKLEAVRLERFG